MRIGVGSGNPVKRRAVEQALESGREEASADGFDSSDECYLSADLGPVTVEPVSVSSGVSEQPIGHAETIAGAENRADAVLDADEYDLAVGIEGGVARFEGADGRFLVMWAVVSDGTRAGRGAGPSLELPAPIAARIENGEELGPVMDDVLDATGTARRGGAAGAFTNGRVDRADALTTAVAGALGPFVSLL